MEQQPSQPSVILTDFSWSTIEMLILAQSVYRIGDANWVAAARSLKHHPVIQGLFKSNKAVRNLEFYSQKNCAAQYQSLIEEILSNNTSSRKKRFGEGPNSAGAGGPTNSSSNSPFSPTNSRTLAASNSSNSINLPLEAVSSSGGSNSASALNTASADNSGSVAATNGNNSSSGPDKMPDAVKLFKHLYEVRISELEHLKQDQEKLHGDINETLIKALGDRNESDLASLESLVKSLEDRAKTLRCDNEGESLFQNALLFPDKALGKRKGPGGRKSPEEIEEAQDHPKKAIFEAGRKRSPSGDSPILIEQPVKRTSELDSDEPPNNDSIPAPVIDGDETDDDDNIPIAKHIKLMKQKKLKQQLEDDDEEEKEAFRSSSPNTAAALKALVDEDPDLAANHMMSATSSSTSLAGPVELSASHKNWKKAIMLIWNEISNHRCAPLFNHPVKLEEAPRYLDIVKKPTDLAIIKQRIRDNVIKSTNEFHRDILHMLQNAFMYNDDDSEIYDMATEMRLMAEEKIRAFKSTEELISGSGTGSSNNPNASNSKGSSADSGEGTSMATRHSTRSINISTSNTMTPSKDTTSSGGSPRKRAGLRATSTPSRSNSPKRR